MATLQSILVPFDGSQPSVTALDHALALATDYDARIEIFHVVPAEDSWSPTMRLDTERAMDAAVERARATLGTRITRRIVTGNIVREIVEAARGFDLIVIGTHGWSGRIHAMLGSVAEAVVRNAPCPVLTVRNAGAGYESFAERRHGRPSLAEQVRVR